MREIENFQLNEKIYNDNKKTVDRKIIKYFYKNGNVLSIPGWIAASFSESLHVGNTVKRCKELCGDGILKSETVYARGYGGGVKQAYKLNLTVRNLKNLISDISLDDLTLLMRTSDYTELLPSLVIYFETALHSQKFPPMTSEVKEIIEHLLKISPSCLKFVLNEEGYKAATRKQGDLFYQSAKFKAKNLHQRKIVKDRLFMHIFIAFARTDWMLHLVSWQETDYIKSLVKLSAADY